MEFRMFNQNEDEPANGWTGETVRHALQQGKKLFVDQNGDIWELDQEGRPKEYCGKILRKGEANERIHERQRIGRDGQRIRE